MTPFRVRVRTGVGFGVRIRVRVRVKVRIGGQVKFRVRMLGRVDVQ